MDPAVDVALARRLLLDQFAAADPRSAGLDLTPVAQGWDNLIVRIGDRLAMRLPIRELAAELVAHEARWLAQVAAPLPVPAPVPVFVGAPSAYYPWPWTVVPWLEGTLVADVPLADRGRIVDGLAAALLALHRPAPAEAPPNPYRGIPLADRDDDARARIGSCAIGSEVLGPAWEAAVDAPAWPGPPLWLHGDPHPHNLLADDHGLAGILDFGDITAGDPASDLAAAWWCFGPDDRARFTAVLDASGRYDAHVWTRAAGWAALLAAAVARDTPLERLATHTCEQLALDPGA